MIFLSATFAKGRKVNCVFCFDTPILNLLMLVSTASLTSLDKI